MGDPMGIGPEIIVKALASTRYPARVHIYGQAEALVAAARSAGIEPFWRNISRDDPQVPEADVLLLDHREFNVHGAPGGGVSTSVHGPSAHAGAASFAFVEHAIAAAQLPDGHPRKAHAIVTAPISKTSWHLAGITKYPGHTELLAERLHAPDSGMLFVGPSLRVMLATIHIPLAEVPRVLTTERVLQAIMLAHRACVDLGIARPRIAVCGLNPHAGEGGILGKEDDAVIAPAIAKAREAGVGVTGPHPADTLFNAAAAPPFGSGLHDCVVAMYHDQGLIPAKLLDGKKTVNVTTGLPMPRTSPAHGTAFDIAGKNVADAASMRAAIELAVRMQSTGHRTA